MGGGTSLVEEKFRHVATVAEVFEQRTVGRIEAQLALQEQLEQLDLALQLWHVAVGTREDDVALVREAEIGGRVLERQRQQRAEGVGAAQLTQHAHGHLYESRRAQTGGHAELGARKVEDSVGDVDSVVDLPLERRVGQVQFKRLGARHGTAQRRRLGEELARGELSGLATHEALVYREGESVGAGEEHLLQDAPDLVDVPDTLLDLSERDAEEGGLRIEANRLVQDLLRDDHPIE